MLTDLQTRKMMRLFKVYNATNSGDLSRADFELIATNVAAAKALPLGGTTHNALTNYYLGLWENLRRYADIDDSGRVTVDEWLAYTDQLLADPEAYEADERTLATTIYDLFNFQPTGTQIDPSDLARFYEAYGIDPGLAQDAFARLDLNRSGGISVQEIRELVREFYHSDDTNAPGNWLFGTF